MLPRRILLLIADHYRDAESIAAQIAVRLRRNGHEVELADALVGLRELPPPQDYDAVVIGTRAGLPREVRAIRTYLEAYCYALREMPVALFFAGLTDPDRETHVFDDLDVHPSFVAPLAVATEPRPAPDVRRLLDRIERGPVARARVITDWPRVRSFADDVSRLVSRQS